MCGSVGRETAEEPEQSAHKLSSAVFLNEGDLFQTQTSVSGRIFSKLRIVTMSVSLVCYIE